MTSTSGKEENVSVEVKFNDPGSGCKSQTLCVSQGKCSRVDLIKFNVQPQKPVQLRATVALISNLLHARRFFCVISLYKESNTYIMSVGLRGV